MNYLTEFSANYSRCAVTRDPSDAGYSRPAVSGDVSSETNAYEMCLVQQWCGGLEGAEWRDLLNYHKTRNVSQENCPNISVF
mgnify:CR=1